MSLELTAAAPSSVMTRSYSKVGTLEGSQPSAVVKVVIRSVSLVALAKATKDTERITTFTTAEGWEPSSVPTLEYERVITEDGAAAVNSNDIMGARVRVDYAAVPGEFTPLTE